MGRGYWSGFGVFVGLGMVRIEGVGKTAGMRAVYGSDD